MSAYTFARRPAGAIAALSIALLLSACNNQLPAPAPVPGQPLTWAQKYELNKARYQKLNEDRINN